MLVAKLVLNIDLQNDGKLWTRPQNMENIRCNCMLSDGPALRNFHAPIRSQLALVRSHDHLTADRTLDVLENVSKNVLENALKNAATC